MSHVDEGALHAYLDGALEEYPAGEARRIRAHLERCERCAEALREARLVRDRAESVLAVPSLNVTPPPLEELKRIATSGAAETRASRSWARRQRLGWAASVVLALGIGWIVRGGMPLPTVGPDRAASTVESPRAEAVEGAETPAQVREAPARVGEDFGGATGALAEARSPGSGDAGTPPSTGRLTENGVEALEAPAETVVAQALERSVPSEETAIVAEARPADASPAEVAAPEPATPPALQDVDVTSVEARQTPRVDDVLEVPTAPSATAELPAESTEVAMATETADTMRAPGVEEPEVVEAADAAEREAATRSEAARLSLASRSAAAGAALTRGVERGPAGDAVRDDEASEPGSLVVPGLEVLSIVWREEGVVPAGVRVIQRLDDGRELELIHLPAGFDPSAVDPAEAGVNELVVPRDQGWLILRAPLEEPELRLLLERMDTPTPDQ